MVLWKLDSHMQKKMKLEQSYSMYKNQLKMDEDLNIESEIIKLLE